MPLTRMVRNRCRFDNPLGCFNGITCLRIFISFVPFIPFSLRHPPNMNINVPKSQMECVRGERLKFSLVYNTLECCSDYTYVESVDGIKM